VNQDELEAVEAHMKRNHAVRAMAVVLGVSAAAFEFYPVRELVAALLMFSIVFGVVGAGFLILIATEELALKGMTLLESRLAYTRGGTTTSPHRGCDPFVRSPR
jgi:hypothetical protein